MRSLGALRGRTKGIAPIVATVRSGWAIAQAQLLTRLGPPRLAVSAGTLRRPRSRAHRFA